MQWITVFLAAFLATGVGAGSALAQQAADDSMEELLGGSPLETEGALFPGALDGEDPEVFADDTAPAAMGDDEPSLGVIAADEVAAEDGRRSEGRAPPDVEASHEGHRDDHADGGDGGGGARARSVNR